MFCAAHIEVSVHVFEVAQPYARELMVERFSPSRIATRAQKRGRELYEIANELPYQVHDVLQEVRDGQIEVGFVHKGLDEFMHKLDVVANRLVVALIVAGGLLGSSLIGILATDDRHSNANSLSEAVLNELLKNMLCLTNRESQPNTARINELLRD